MALSPQDVHDRQFKLVRQTTGYDMDEVDAFLDEVEAEVTRLHAEIAARTPAGATAGQPGSSPQESGVTAEQGAAAAARLLELAQRTADELVAESRRQAEATADDIQRRVQAAVSALEAQRAELEDRVARLRAFEADVRSRLRGYLQTQLRDLDASAEQPGD